MQSPSHTVGLEQEKRFMLTGRKLSHKIGSPSHTVGLELVFSLFKDFVKEASPSHTVGLEHNNWIH